MAAFSKVFTKKVLSSLCIMETSDTDCVAAGDDLSLPHTFLSHRFNNKNTIFLLSSAHKDS